MEVYTSVCYSNMAILEFFFTELVGGANFSPILILRWFLIFAFRKSCAHMVDVGQPPVKRRRPKLSLTKSSDSRVNSDERYVTPRLEEQSQKEHVNEASDDLAHETYFSANFKTVCSTVLSEISPERHVFNDGEINTVQRFMELPSKKHMRGQRAMQ